MKKNMAILAMKNIISILIIVLPLYICLNKTLIPMQDNNSEIDINVKVDEPVSKEIKVVLLDLEGNYCDIKCFLAKKKQTIEFLSKTFGVDSKKITNDLIEKNKNIMYDEFNIGALQDKDGKLIKYDSFENGMIEYLINYCKNNSNLVDNTKVPYTGDSEYIVDLIKYFTDIYDNVDYLTAVSIGAAESGYYKVGHMLKSNNIYGGMSSNGLIKYKNIEYGVLSYIRLLSFNYYGKGLNTLESIGRVYCPTISEAGNKVASPHWINLVNNAKSYYKDSESVVTVDMLIND